jgi:hypothetical protein
VHVYGQVHKGRPRSVKFKISRQTAHYANTYKVNPLLRRYISHRLNDLGEIAMSYFLLRGDCVEIQDFMHGKLKKKSVSIVLQR